MGFLPIISYAFFQKVTTLDFLCLLFQHFSIYQYFIFQYLWKSFIFWHFTSFHYCEVLAIGIYQWFIHFIVHGYFEFGVMQAMLLWTFLDVPLHKHILLCMCLRIEMLHIRINACLILIQTANEHSRFSALIYYPTSLTVFIAACLLQHVALSSEIIVILSCNSWGFNSHFLHE